jgi:single stranded DNA-binding protein
MTNDIKFENSVHMTGYVGKNPEFTVFESKNRRARFSIAVSQPVGRGQQPKKPMWLDIEAWNEVADKVQSATFGKGSLVTVFGSLAPNYWEQTIGEVTIERQKVKVKLNHLEIIAPKSSAAETSPPQATSVPESDPVHESAPAHETAPVEEAAQFRTTRARRTAKTA